MLGTSILQISKSSWLRHSSVGNWSLICLVDLDCLCSVKCVVPTNSIKIDFLRVLDNKSLGWNVLKADVKSRKTALAVVLGLSRCNGLISLSVSHILLKMMDYRLAFINFLFPRLFLQQAKAAVIPLMEGANHLGPFF